MEDKNKKDEKFKFVSMDEVKDSKEIEVLDTLDSSQEEQIIIEDKAIDEDETIDFEPIFDNSQDISGRIYFSFETRVFLMIFVSLLLFALGCFFILKIVSFGKNDVVTFTEDGQAIYQVCSTEDNLGADSCVGEGLEYISSAVNKILVGLDYQAVFSKNIDYDMSYHVVGILKIFDSKSSDKVLYENEDLLIEKEKVDVDNQIGLLHTNVEIDYAKYNNYVLNYKEKYSLDPHATYEVILYINEGNESRKVITVNVPLGKQTFDINKRGLVKVEREVKAASDSWNTKNIIDAVVATISIIGALILLYRTTNLLLKANVKKDKYHATLDKILKKYDKDIVVSKDGYIEDSSKRVIKVNEFDELVRVHETIKKPIIYSKVNDVKSDFIVEDSSSIYKYVLKEADLENEVK